jgi:hypothetical protein
MFARHIEAAMRPNALLSAALAVAVIVIGTWPAEAGYTERTRRLCLHANYDDRERLADRGDGDAIYCSAVWHAVAYADETRTHRERQASRAKAFQRYRRAIDLGYDFDRIAMFGRTFAELIADGERLDSGPAVSRRGGDGDVAGCMARIGIECAAQCAGNVNCQAACTGNNAWQCRR